MADAAYKEWPFIFSSRGIQARNVDDAVPPAFYLNLDNCEELFESSFSQKLGSTIINRSGTTPFPLTGTPISLGKLAGLSGSAWRYAATTAGKLYRRTGLTAGAYSLISSAVSGSPMTMASYRPDISSFPTIFFADANGMLKDNGTYTAPEQMGIFQPRYPCIAQSQLPSSITFDNYTSIGGFVFVPSSGLGQAIVAAVNTTLTSAVIVIGLQPVSVADPTQIQLFQLLTIGAETVLVLLVTPTGFVAVFTNGHTIGTAVTSQALTVTVPQSTTATISKPFGFDPIATWPKVLSQSDYIGIQIYIGDPQQIQSITIKFDCGDGSFNSDYFWKVIAQGPEQQLLNTVNDPAVAATDAILSNSIGVYNNAEGGVAPLATGLNVWNPFLFQLSDFSGAGRADFNDPVFNWQNVNGYQIQVETNDQASTVVSLAALILEGGSGPDSFAGVGYDYMFTFYNANDGAESNPSTEMSDINPPISTTLVYPRRQPVKVSLTWGTGTVPITVDPQVTHLRIYRRGGTLGDNFRRVDEVPITGGNFGQVYIDTASDADIQASDFISLTNDVPVTSTLPVPVNTTLTSPLTPSLPFNASLVSVVLTANMSVGQQFTIGSPTAIANNFEIAIVLFVASSTTFYAFIQNNHSSGESVQATARVGQPVTLMALAYTQMYFAGDPNNPHFLYFSNATNPQAVGSASYIEVGSPDNPITVIANFKGTLYVSTKTAWWLIAPGTNSKPTPYPTAARHGCVAPFGYTITEEGIYYQAIDGMRFFAGGASQYLTQDIEFIFQGVGTTPIVEADQSQLSKTVMAWWNNMIFVSYVGLDANRHRLVLHCLPEEAEALTRNGWKIHSEIAVGEEILAYDTETETCQWTPVLEKSVFEFDGDLTTWEAGKNGKKFSFDFTHDHKWAWRGEIGKGPSWRKTNVRLRKGEDIGLFGDVIQAAPLGDGLPSLLEPLEAEVLGWIVTDGRIIKNNGEGKWSAVVYQAVASDATERLQQILSPFCSSKTPYLGKHKDRDGDGTQMIRYNLRTDFIDALLKKCGYRSWKDLPSIVCKLNYESSAAMLEAMLKADGHEGRQTNFTQKHGKPQIEAIRILAALCGRATSRTSDPRDEDDCTTTGIMKYPYIDCEKIKRSTTSYTGMVWCPSTKFQTWIARYKDSISITGNTVYKRWRNDDIDAQSILIEEDIGQLLYGNSQGYVYLDRQDVPTDEVVSGGVIVPGATSINLQTPYQNQEMPDIQKNYVELTLDVNTQGQTLTPTLIFDDGAFSVTLPTFSNAARGKINFNLNFGKGYTYYKVSLNITGSLTQFVYIFQCSVKAIPVAKTRLTFDTYQLALGIEENKFSKNTWWDTDCTQPIDVQVFYDGSASPGFTFAIPATGGLRSTFRQRLPAPTFRLIRFVGVSTADFRLWNSKIEYKPLASGKGYQVQEFISN